MNKIERLVEMAKEIGSVPGLTIVESEAIKEKLEEEGYIVEIEVWKWKKNHNREVNIIKKEEIKESTEIKEAKEKVENMEDVKMNMEEIKKNVLVECLVKNYSYEEDEAREEAENNKDDYLVLTYDEAEEAAREDIKNTLEDCGYKCLNLNINYYLDEDFFKEIFEEQYQFYIDDIREEPASLDEFKNRLEEEMHEVGVDTEEEFLEYLLNSINNYVDEYIFQFGEEGLNDIIKNNPWCIDEEKLIDDIILNDGRGSLAYYDGIEHEVFYNDEWYYIYKQN